MLLPATSVRMMLTVLEPTPGSELRLRQVAIRIHQTGAKDRAHRIGQGHNRVDFSLPVIVGDWLVVNPGRAPSGARTPIWVGTRGAVWSITSGTAVDAGPSTPTAEVPLGNLVIPFRKGDGGQIQGPGSKPLDAAVPAGLPLINTDTRVHGSALPERFRLATLVIRSVEERPLSTVINPSDGAAGALSLTTTGRHCWACPRCQTIGLSNRQGVGVGAVEFSARVGRFRLTSPGPTGLEVLKSTTPLR